MWGARSEGGCPVQPLALGGRRDAHVWRSSDRRSTRERRNGQAGAWRGRDDVGDPAQAHCVGGSARHEPRCPPFRQRRLLLGVGRPAPRQASQEPGRVTPRHWGSLRTSVHPASPRTIHVAPGVLTRVLGVVRCPCDQLLHIESGGGCVRERPCVSCTC